MNCRLPIVTTCLALTASCSEQLPANPPPTEDPDVVAVDVTLDAADPDATPPSDAEITPSGDPSTDIAPPETGGLDSDHVDLATTADPAADPAIDPSPPDPVDNAPEADPYEGYFPCWDVLAERNFGRYPFYASSWEDALERFIEQELIWTARNTQAALNCPEAAWPYNGISRDQADQAAATACVLYREKHRLQASFLCPADPRDPPRLPDGRIHVRRDIFGQWWQQTRDFQYRADPDSEWGIGARLNGVRALAVDAGCSIEWEGC